MPQKRGLHVFELAPLDPGPLSRFASLHSNSSRELWHSQSQSYLLDDTACEFGFFVLQQVSLNHPLAFWSGRQTLITNIEARTRQQTVRKIRCTIRTLTCLLDLAFALSLTADT